jgi:hypothetical protein
LREKVIKYDPDYFFNAIKGIDRKKFSSADDLLELSDMQLIEGCKETEIITVLGFKHLNYIRDMRNFASAAHPNQNELTGLQVAGWLETCIMEVLAKEPSEAAILVKKLLVHIREESFDPTSVKPINAKIQQLPKELSGSLLRSIFGMYVDPRVSPNVKRNIDLISKSVWNHADDNAKSEIGFRYGFYSVNGDLGKKELASNFLTTVDGLSYLTEDIKAIEIKERLENLLNAHYEYHNFFNEEPHARILFNYVHGTSEIPTSIAYEYVKTLTICRLGNSYGVARSAVPYYDEMIKMFQDPLIRNFLNLLDDQVIIEIFKDDNGLELDRQRFHRYKEIANFLHEKTSNYITKRSIEIVLASKKEDIINKKVYGKIKLLLES